MNFIQDNMESVSKKILIVDDYPDNRKLLSFILSEENHDVLEVSDGDKAIECAVRDRPDLILLDIMMPGKDGYQVCTELKQRPACADIPIIFLSALSETDNKIKGFELGAVDYITKPFDEDEVVARVRTQLRLRHVIQSLAATSKQLLDKQKLLEEDLKAASDIQASLILKHPLPLDGLDFTWQYMPCEWVGGDVFNVYQLDENHLALFMFDVSGHGVPAAMVSVSVSQMLSPQTGQLLKTRGPSSHPYTLTAPAEVLRQLDAEYPLERFDRYFTIAYLILNARTGQLRYSSAGHPPPVVVRDQMETGSLLMQVDRSLGWAACCLSKKTQSSSTRATDCFCIQMASWSLKTSIRRFLAKRDSTGNWSVVASNPCMKSATISFTSFDPLAIVALLRMI